MTRKDYELIASAVRDAKAYGEPVEKMLADRLAGANPRFNRPRFIEACKVPA